MNHNARIITFYLPQYHPIPENDEWWEKGFTEWTNVNRAKPLFYGHYQPKLPTDLGYYDLRVPEVREQQAQMAKEFGIDGFAYWHYWFGNGKRLLERPFNDVLKSGKPDFPFCLAWANHSWKAKSWNIKGVIGNDDPVLIKQDYYGKNDYISHFFEILPAFKDKRYIYIDNKPLFLIYNPIDIPDLSFFISIWNGLAKENGFDGIYFISYKHNPNHSLSNYGINGYLLDMMPPYKPNLFVRAYRFLNKLFSHPLPYCIRYLY